MPRTRFLAMTIAAWSAVVTAGAWGHARAQGPVPTIAATGPAQPGTPVWRANLGTRFAGLDLDRARAKANAELKLISVFVFDSLDPDMHDEIAFMRETTWRNPTLATYLDWRCVTIEMDAGFDPWILSRWGLDHRDLPGVVVLLPGKETEQVIGKALRPWNPLSDEIAQRTPDILKNTVPDVVPSATNVLFQVDFAHERLAARDPVWAIASEHANPMPDGPPGEDPLHQVEDENALAVNDPGPGDPGWRAGGLPAAPALPMASRTTAPAPEHTLAPYDVMERLEQARAAVREHDARLAAGLYTWVWERGEDLDPASRAFRRCVLPLELRELAAVNDLARQRFSDVRDQASRRLLWASFSELMVWFTLNEVCGDGQENIHYLDLYTNDRDEAAMMPRAHAAAYRLMAARDTFIDPWRIDQPSAPGSRSAMPSDPDGAALAHVRAVVKRLAEPRKSNIPADEYEKLQTFRREYLIDEAARLHAALLHAGRDALAREAVEVALKALITPADRAQLLTSAVFCALATGHARPDMHAGLLADAAALGRANLTLELRLRETRP